MMQQINLYQPMFRKQKKVFSAVAMLQVGLIVLGLFGLIYASFFWQYQNLQKQLSTADKQAEQIQAQLQTYKDKQAGAIRSKLLEREVARLEREFKKGQKIFKLISEGSLGNTTGFSTYFRGLAAGHIDGMWLTGIDVGQGGRTLDLEGMTLAAELVPKYLQQLASEPVFENIAFNVLDIIRSDEDKGGISFIVGTNALEEESEIAQSTF